MPTPSASNTSALPQRLDTERLPCLATRTPHAATTSAAADRDVDGAGAIAAGAARVEDLARPARQRHRVRAHRPRQADDLRPAARPSSQPDQQPRQLRRRGLPRHHELHRRRRLRRPSDPRGGSASRMQTAAEHRQRRRYQRVQEVAQHAAGLRRSAPTRDGTARRAPATRVPQAHDDAVVRVRAATSSSPAAPSSATTSEW